MKKEKWILSEIDKWQEAEIIGADTAEVLKKRYEPKKNMRVLTILFSIIGTLLIGMGVILIGAHNLWYMLPLAARAGIAFLPMLLSQGFMCYVLRKKMKSTSFRESAAILNMAGVFATIAWIGQIFHLPSDFTNYIFICGVLSLPAMLLMRAVCPLPIYYWTVINGGLFIEEAFAVPVSVLLFAVGAWYAVSHFKEESGKSAGLAELTAIAGFVFLLVASLVFPCDPTLLLFAYFSLLILSSFLWKRAGQAMMGVGTLGVLVLMTLFIIVWFWEYEPEYESVPLLVLTILLVAGNVFFALWRYLKQQLTATSLMIFSAVILRSLWTCFGLSGDAAAFVFMILFNLLLLAMGIVFIWDGVKNIKLLSANAGILCVFTSITVRFFDSEMSLGIRGLIFVVLGIGFLLFNLYLARMKKQAKEDVR